MQAAATFKEYSRDFGDLDLQGLVLSLMQQTSACDSGDGERAVAMLVSQAHTLDAIFNYLARCAVDADYIDSLDRYLKLALRAQSQCRATWEAVTTIQNPPVMGYVRQANIAHGPQQVNNALAGDDRASRARQNPFVENELLEKKDGERLDARTAGAAGCNDPEMAAVGKVHRSKDGGR